MEPWLDPRGAGDPSRTHSEALQARVALEDARAAVAERFGASSREVVFCSGGTEAAVTAAWGGAGRGPHQVVTAVEHSCVRQAASQFGSVTEVPVDSSGRVDPDRVAAALRPDTSLVHVQLANHEVGTLQPVEPIAELCRARGVLLHVDAAAAAGRVPIDFRASGIDLLSLSGHKLGGPTGTGALLVRRGLRLRPLLVGGDQERARRAGMENLAGLVGLGAVCAELDPASEGAAQRGLIELARSGVGPLDGVHVYGHPTERAPHILCLGLDGLEPQPVMQGLDRAGVAAHSGSACATADLEPSPVLAAMGVDAHRSLRVSVGWSSSRADIELLLEALPKVLADLRALSRGVASDSPRT